jgi:hypothetical protein
MYDLTIEYQRFPQGLSRRPKGVNSVDLLLNTVAQYDVMPLFFCWGSFEYVSTDGFESKIQLPMPLPLVSEQGFTHMDSVDLSRRGDDGLEYSVEVNIIESEARQISHAVFLFAEDEQLQASLPRRMLLKAHGLSSSLVEKAF